jgi:hypothetical protein
MDYPADWQNTNFYFLLGLERDATPQSIKKEYLWNAKKFHPDLNGGDKRAEDRFRRIQQAYEVLSNPETRQLYNQFLTAATQPDAKSTRESSSEQAKREGSPASTIPSEGQPGANRVPGAVVLAIAGLVVFVAIASSQVSAVVTNDVTAESAPTAQQLPSQPTKPATPSRYSEYDLEACRNFREFKYLEKYPVPTNANEQRDLFNNLHLDFSGFFYLASDPELLRLSESLSGAAFLVATLAGEQNDVLWGMATTDFQDSYNRLWAVCGEVR